MYTDLIRKQLNREDAIKLLRRAIGVPSVTGAELAFANFVADELRRVGAADVHTEEFLPGRANARGVYRGEGHGRNLMFLGHLDTVHVRGWQEHWAGTEREDPFAASVIDGEIWGRGAADLKGGICAVLAALDTVRRAGLRLRGDIVCVFPGDEESGELNSGVSAGIKAAVAQIKVGAIPRADFAVYVEPTQLQVFVAQMGFFITDITLIGMSAYFGLPELGIDALKAAYEALSGLWTHSRELGRDHSHPLMGNAFLLVTAIRGGGHIAVPERCEISLIRKLLPGDDLEEARQALERAVGGAITDPRIQVKFAYPAGRDHAIGGTACETSADLEGVRLLSRAAASSMDGKGEIQGAPYWSEAPFTTELGIPTVYCAPGNIATAHTFNERISVDEYLAAVEAFACMMAEFCGGNAAENVRTV